MKKGQKEAFSGLLCCQVCANEARHLRARRQFDENKPFQVSSFAKCVPIEHDISEVAASLMRSKFIRDTDRERNDIGGLGCSIGIYCAWSSVVCLEWLCLHGECRKFEKPERGLVH